MSIAPDNDPSFAEAPAPSPVPPPRNPAAVRGPAPGGTRGNPRADSLNLSGRPFGNSRPVVRISILLWLLGLALLLSNVIVFRNYLSASADKRAQIAHGEEELLHQQTNVQDLQNRLNGYDLVRLNDQIDFLNTQIDARAFSWSLLIDRMAGTLPNDVRLNRLTPGTESKAKRERERGQRGKLPEGEVDLTISGVTRRDEALNQFIKNLFAHPAFKNPNLLQESQVDAGGPLVKFEATVTYLPGAPPRSAVVEEAPAGTPAPAGAPARKKTVTTTTGTKATTSKATAQRAPGGRP